MFYSLVLLSSALLLLSSCAQASNRDVYDAYKERNQELNNILAMSMDRGSRLCVGQNDCCNSSNKCGLGEGDCDTDSDCVSGLECGACDHEFDVPTVGTWTMEEENFSQSDACCRLPRELEDRLLDEE